MRPGVPSPVLERGLSRWSTAAWHALAVTLVLLAPSQVSLGRPVWALPPAELPQVILWGAAYLGLAVWFAGPLTRSVKLGPGIVLSGAAFWCVLAGLLPLFRDDLPLSRNVLAMAGTTAVVLAILPTVWRRARGVGLVLLSVAIGLVAWAGIKAGPSSRLDNFGEWVVQTALQPVKVRSFPFPRLEGLPVDGGAIAAEGLGYLAGDRSGPTVPPRVGRGRRISPLPPWHRSSHQPGRIS